MNKILPGDLVRDDVRNAVTKRVLRVENGRAMTDNGEVVLEKCVLVKRGPAHDLAKARHGDGRFTDQKFAQGDKVKVTGNVPNKGKKGKVTMVSGDSHVVSHEDGSHASYDEKHLSHDK